MPTTPSEAVVSVRAKAIASGLVRTVRAATGSKLIHGMLRLESHNGDDYYWIASTEAGCSEASSCPRPTSYSPSLSTPWSAQGAKANLALSVSGSGIMSP